jgi:hypothetical protein
MIPFRLFSNSSALFHLSSLSSLMPSKIYRRFVGIVVPCVSQHTFCVWVGSIDRKKQTADLAISMKPIKRNPHDV